MVLPLFITSYRLRQEHSEYLKIEYKKQRIDLFFICILIDLFFDQDGIIVTPFIQDAPKITVQFDIDFQFRKSYPAHRCNDLRGPPHIILV